MDETVRMRGMFQLTGWGETRALSNAMVMIGRSSSSASAMIMIGVSGKKP